jgi:hypothetical protein
MPGVFLQLDMKKNGSQQKNAECSLHRKLFGNIRGNPSSTECLLKMHVVNR